MVGLSVSACLKFSVALAASPLGEKSRAPVEPGQGIIRRQFDRLVEIGKRRSEIATGEPGRATGNQRPRAVGIDFQSLIEIRHGFFRLSLGQQEIAAIDKDGGVSRAMLDGAVVIRKRLVGLAPLQRDVATNLIRDHTVRVEQDRLHAICKRLVVPPLRAVDGAAVGVGPANVLAFPFAGGDQAGAGGDARIQFDPPAAGGAGGRGWRLFRFRRRHEFAAYPSRRTERSKTCPARQRRRMPKPRQSTPRKAKEPFSFLPPAAWGDPCELWRHLFQAGRKKL